jgi:nucleotide-binding universal stress UspA family protein
MFSNIVVGTDGSDTAAVAVNLAADLARQHGALLHVVNAYKVSTGGVAVVQAGAMAVADHGLSGEVARGASEKLLTEVAQTISDANVTTRAAVGSPADVVIAVAEEVGADLIVVGSKGMRGARRVIGSVPNTIAHRAPCHVLIAKTA